MASFLPCLHEEADTRIFALSTEAAKRPNKKISSCAVDTDVVVLVIPVMRGWQKSPAIVGVKSNCPAVFGYFVKIYSLPEKPTTDDICTIE